MKSPELQQRQLFPPDPAPGVVGGGRGASGQTLRLAPALPAADRPPRADERGHGGERRGRRGHGDHARAAVGAADGQLDRR